MNKEKRIWIELDKADSFEEAQENCKLANKALIKLGIRPDMFFTVRHTKEDWNGNYRKLYPLYRPTYFWYHRFRRFDLEYLAK